jgi:hypothetical protein
MNQDKSLPIIETAYRLVLELNKTVVKFPRHQRGGLGRRIEEAGVNFLETLTAARYRDLSSKPELLTRASNYLDNLKLCVRMSFDLGYLPNRSYEELARTITETGRMLGGWRKSRKQSGGVGR